MPLPKIDEIDDLDRQALRVAWREVVRTNAPPRMSQLFMRRVLAFEIQVQHFGGLPKNTQRDLTKASRKDITSPASAHLKPGGRFLREWNGKTHIVDVTEDGFLWNGLPHRSLSAIARAITGAHWSGPRFFGLDKGKAK